MLLISWRMKEENVILQACVCHLLISSQEVNMTHMPKQYAAGTASEIMHCLASICICSLIFSFVENGKIIFGTVM